MSKTAVEHRFTGATTPITSYDASKTNLGSLMRQKTGASNDDNWAGPHPICVNRIGSIASTISNTHILNWSPRYSWIFTTDVVAAAVSRRINYLIHDKQEDIISYQGFITANFTLAGAKTMRGLRAFVVEHTGGTVAVDGTGVIGSGTNFVTHRVSCGSRIGFGTTSPTGVTTWYEIAQSGIVDNNYLGLSASAGSLPSGTPYVIEELHIATSMTNATLGSGGLFLLKGLRPELFTAGGTNINDTGIVIDNQRGIYWLADRTPLSNNVACGLAADTESTYTGQYVYVLNGTSSPNVYKYNIRAPLTIPTNGGRSTSAFLYATTGNAVAGTVSQVNNGRIGTANHGPGNGVKSLYFVTTTNVYRAAESNIQSGAVGWISDTMTEIPAGTTSTYAASATLSQIDYADTADLFYISTTNNRVHATKYKTDGSAFDHIIFSDNKQLDSTLADSSSYPFPNTIDLPMYVWTENGYAYVVRSSTTATQNQLYCVPLNADWAYASSTQQRIIGPKLNTPGASRFYRVYVNKINYVGEDGLTLPTEPYRVYARISGIDDNTGEWTLLDDSHSLSLISAADNIQFMFEFRTLGLVCIPCGLYGFTVVYEDASTDSHYQPSVSTSSITNKQFGWRHAVAFGGSVPNLRVRLYDAENANLLVDDDTDSPTGTFERSTDGSSWSAWSNTDKSNETTYVRYTPASLGDNIKVRALLTQL